MAYGLLSIVTISVALQAVAATPQFAPKETGGMQSLFNGKDLTGWQTTGNWIPQKDGSLLIQPRKGEKGWQRYVKLIRVNIIFILPSVP